MPRYIRRRVAGQRTPPPRYCTWYEGRQSTRVHQRHLYCPYAASFVRPFTKIPSMEMLRGSVRACNTHHWFHRTLLCDPARDCRPAGAPVPQPESTQRRRISRLTRGPAHTRRGGHAYSTRRECQLVTPPRSACGPPNAHLPSGGHSCQASGCSSLCRVNAVQAGPRRNGTHTERNNGDNSARSRRSSGLAPTCHGAAAAPRPGGGRRCTPALPPFHPQNTCRGS